MKANAECYRALERSSEVCRDQDSRGDDVGEGEEEAGRERNDGRVAGGLLPSAPVEWSGRTWKTKPTRQEEHGMDKRLRLKRREGRVQLKTRREVKREGSKSS